MSNSREYFKSAVSVDNVIFGFDDTDLKVLLIRRGEEPFYGEWALPGDLVYPDENINTAANRILFDLTGLENVYLEQVMTFGEVDRHPKGRVITIGYFSLINIKKVTPKASSFANEISWKNVRDVKELAFDHFKIMTTCLMRLQTNLRFKPIGFELLPERFTLTELQLLYESVLGQELDKRNFRKKITKMNIIKDLNIYQTGVAHRPARLYSFDEESYQQALKEGITFEL